ncbi:protein INAPERTURATE POLLEN1 [Solanum pennellii]|uniref:Protein INAPERTURATE POLLEN1 n=1 Tax=Solanum pennellii TaxID=28526 RepID=A0ABM1HF54_SOLPN|nr:protein INAPERTURATE POLLEN1 [Solanum pennellii]
MFKAIAHFGFKKSSKPFKDYYDGWFKTLKNVLLPQLRHAMSSSATSGPILLASHVEVMHRHFLKYYEALDLAAANDVSQVLYPDWRNPFEKPFLWLGDLHPYLFTNLLRSFIGDSESEIDSGIFDKLQNWHVVMAWKSPSRKLTTGVDQIECGLRLMVPALAARARDAQAKFVEKMAVEWGKCEGRKQEMKGVVGESAAAEMEELVGVFVDANRLRRSVLSDILNVMDVNQAAVFLEALAQFLVGFRNRELLSQFDKCSLEL